MTPKRIEQLADIPSNCVRTLGPLTVDTLRDWASKAGHRYVEVDLGSARDKKAVLTAIGRAFSFPDWYGANLDALYDCLTDLPADRPSAGYVVVLQKLPYNASFDVEQRDALLDVFRDAAEAFADDGIALRVFHSS